MLSVIVCSHHPETQLLPQPPTPTHPVASHQTTSHPPTSCQLSAATWGGLALGLETRDQIPCGPNVAPLELPRMKQAALARLRGECGAPKPKERPSRICKGPPGAGPLSRRMQPPAWPGPAPSPPAPWLLATGQLGSWPWVGGDHRLVASPANLR